MNSPRNRKCIIVTEHMMSHARCTLLLWMKVWVQGMRKEWYNVSWVWNILRQALREVQEDMKKWDNCWSYPWASHLMEPSPRPGHWLAEGTLQADPDSPGGDLGSMSSSADSSPGATLMIKQLSPCAARCLSMWHSEAMACADGTQGGYWKVVATLVSVGLSSSTNVTLWGNIGQSPPHLQYPGSPRPSHAWA